MFKYRFRTVFWNQFSPFSRPFLFHFRLRAQNGTGVSDGSNRCHHFPSEGPGPSANECRGNLSGDRSQLVFCFVFLLFLSWTLFVFRFVGQRYPPPPGTVFLFVSRPENGTNGKHEHVTKNAQSVFYTNYIYIYIYIYMYTLSYIILYCFVSCILSYSII